MSTLSHVLCAVDIDDAGREVFAHALELSRKRGARLLVVHAASPVTPLNHGASKRVEFLRRLREQALAAGVDAWVTVQRGDAAAVILLHARARNADLIVVGATRDLGRGGRVTSIAERVLREAPCPTLVVPRGAPVDAGFGRVLCAVDWSPASRAAADQAFRLAAGSDQAVMLLHVVNGPGPRERPRWAWGASHEFYRGLGASALQDLRELLPAAGDPRMARIVVGHPVTEILRSARTMNATLLVVGARPRNRVGRRLLGRIGHLLRQAECPVLAVPEPPPAEPQRVPRPAA